MTTRLKLYNKALFHCGETRISTLTDDVPARYVLDEIWDDGFITAVLEQGFWKFANRTQQITYNSALVVPDFGLQYGFNKPTDYVHLTAICSDEFFSEPLLEYDDEPGFWYANIDQFYIKYVSNDSAYGSDLSLWPQTFVKFAALELALTTSHALNKSQDKLAALEKKLHMALSDARAKDAVNQPTRFFPRGRWVRSRGDGYYSYDRLGTQLIG